MHTPGPQQTIPIGRCQPPALNGHAPLAPRHGFTHSPRWTFPLGAIGPRQQRAMPQSSRRVARPCFGAPPAPSLGVLRCPCPDVGITGSTAAPRHAEHPSGVGGPHLACGWCVSWPLQGTRFRKAHLSAPFHLHSTAASQAPAQRAPMSPALFAASLTSPHPPAPTG